MDLITVNPATANEKISLRKRMRRNRMSSAIRNLVREITLSKNDFVMPFFLLEGTKRNETDPHLPGICKLSTDLAICEIEKAHKKGIQGFTLFPIIPKEKKTENGLEALNPDGLLIRAIRSIKKELPSICLITDVALDPFTLHGHDGVLSPSGEIMNDETLQILGEAALIQTQAGADVIAPSDMMDGRIQHIRHILDLHDYTQTPILSYAVKYASSFYGPFREVLQSHLAFGDKKTYQMDPGNHREAVLEVALDEEEGSDMLMIKPAHTYLDIIRKIREISNKPLAAYHVSGEYAMIMAAAQKGYMEPEKAFYETLLSIKRAGADFIFTYAVNTVLPILDQS